MLSPRISREIKIVEHTACNGSNNSCLGWHGSCTTLRSNLWCLTTAERLNGLSSVREVNNENEAKLLAVKPNSCDKNIINSFTEATETFV